MEQKPYNPEEALPPVDDTRLPKPLVETEYSDDRAEVKLGDSLPELEQQLRKNARNWELLAARQKLISLSDEKAPQSQIVGAQDSVTKEEDKLRSDPRPQAE